MKKLLTLSLVFAMMAVMLGGCGSADSGSQEADKTNKVKVINVDLTEEQYAFGVDKGQPELLQKVNDFIKEIQENGKFDEVCNKYFGGAEPTPVKSAELNPSKDQLVVATNAAFEPFEYTKGDSYYGIDMELAAMLAEKLGKELVIQNMKFDAVCLSVGQHKCDIAMAGLTVQEERKKYVDFADSYYNASQRLIVREDNKEFASCKDVAAIEKILKTKDKSVKIGVQNGTTDSFIARVTKKWDMRAFR